MDAEQGRRSELKQEFVRSRGYWSEIWDDTLRLDPDFFESYLAFSSVPWRHGVLEPKIKELIYVAIDVSTTHLYDPGTRIHMRNALKYGATQDELMEVMELTSVLGIHSATSGVPILMEELKAAGREHELPPAELGEKERWLKEEFTKARGYWSEVWNHIVRLSPEFFEAYMRFSSVPWKKGTLDPKIKEFIYIAIDVATTHLYDPGTRIHIRNALKYGATAKEIMEIFELVSVLGIHAMTSGIPILVDEVKSAQRQSAAE
jgi:alkylhydroperoxidase/carboxymuconolactone decarboxylase family protein YurZ